MNRGPELITRPKPAWEAFAALLQARMRALNIRQNQLAAVAGTTDNTIRKMQQVAQDSYRRDLFEHVVASLYLQLADVEDVMESGDVPDALVTQGLDAAKQDFHQRLRSGRTITQPDQAVDDMATRVESMELRLARPEVSLSRIARHLGVE